jgi:UDP-N-acetylmuramoyl-tripeptide--D-alanyl-D-alanine ligase
MRMDVVRLAGGAVLVDDSYNANPTSMRAALDALVAIDATRRVAIVGVMAELAEPVHDHLAVASHARELGIELIPVGTDLYGIAPADDPLTVLGALEATDAVLVKGSRIAALDRLAARLRAAPS